MKNHLLRDGSKRPTVSVVMPVYNGAPYLQATIESILCQTFTDFEFVIIDDESTDGSWDILLTYAAKDTRIILKRNVPNAGACKTSNLLLSLAKGELIARQDQDDIALPEKLAAQVAFLNDHPEVGLLGTAYYRLSTEGQHRLRQPPPTHTSIRWRLLFDCAFCHSSVMLRRRLFDTGELYYKELSGAQDYELWARLAKRTRASTLPIPLVIYRELEHSMTSMCGDKLKQAIIDVSTEQIHQLLPQHELSRDDVETMRRLRSPRRLSEKELALGQVMFDLLEAFAREPDIDPDSVHVLKQDWIRRVMATTPLAHCHFLWESGLLRLMLNGDPRSVLLAGVFDAPWRTVRRIRYELARLF